MWFSRVFRTSCFGNSKGARSKAGSMFCLIVSYAFRTILKQTEMLSIQFLSLKMTLKRQILTRLLTPIAVIRFYWINNV